MDMGYALSNRIGETRRRRNEETLSRLVGEQVASGDWRGGASALMRSGDVQGGIALQGQGLQMQQLDDARKQQLGAYAYQTLTQLRAMTEEQRAMVAPNLARRLSEFGIDARQIDYSDLSDRVLDAEIAVLAPHFGPQPQDPYTIGPGQQRRGRNNELLASAPFKPDEPAAPAPFTLSPGQTRYDPTGQPIANAVDPAAGRPDYNVEKSFRGEFESDPRVAGYVEASRAYDSMAGYADDNTGASDIALVYALFKTLDPGGRVTESEYESAGRAMGLPAQLITALRGLQEGVFLDAQTRTDIVSVAQRALTRHEQDFGRALEYYQGLAPSYGIDPSRGTYDSRQARAPLGGGDVPQVGAEDAPNIDPDDEALLFDQPTPANIQFFNQLYGEGAAENLLGGAR
jgi:hypothetical protein